MVNLRTVRTAPTILQTATAGSRETNRPPPSCRIAHLMLLLWWLVVAGTAPPPGEPSPSLPPRCPSECICLSHSQVMCNSVLLRDVPAGLSPDVVQISLARADIQVLRSDAFIGLRVLKKINLDSVNLSTIRPFAFRGLPHLREIIIQNTPLATVHPFSFAGLQNVSTISLAHNKIAQIEASAFAGTNFLRLLTLKHNPLKRILAGSFSALTEVGHIELPSGIKVIEPLAFLGIEGLETIELAYMDLDELKRDTFAGASKVGRLSLKESDLGIIRVGAFDNMATVQVLEIINNKIDAVEELALAYNTSVSSFYLVGNHMLQTPASVYLDVENIVISGNHLPCDCGANSDPYSSTLAVTEDFAASNMCISPLKVRGLSLEAGSLSCRGDSGSSARASAWGTKPDASSVTLLAMFLTNFTFS